MVPAPKEPDPILKFRKAGEGFPGREEREEMFQRLDANGNGRLSVSEVDDAVDDLWPTYAFPGSILFAFKAADVDGNGLITRREFAAMVRALAYFGQLHGVWGDALADDTRFDLEDFDKATKALWSAAGTSRSSRPAIAT